MNFNKATFLTFLMFISVMTIMVNSSSEMILSMKFMCMNQLEFSSMGASLSMTQISKIYLLMVSLVTSMVMMYSLVYLEGYNYKKFFWLVIMFFSSMNLLTMSNSMIFMLMGWDFLGLTSVMLILFYPNKVSLQNSNMTIMFNRLGDVLLIVATLMILENYYMFTMNMSMNLLCLIMVVVCSMTKSAQFPLSSWLPAAMSAPTPISAMVHSSTLVTAGIFMMLKMFYSLNETLKMSYMLIAYMGFMGGCVLAIMEMDFKKMIAFSTMSQISMMIMMIMAGWKMISMIHMLSHAYFKTLLFCCAGTLFSESLTTQWASALKSKLNKTILVMVMISIFMMTGLMFSSSFYSKEWFLNTTSILTLVYILFLFSGTLSMIYSFKLIDLTSKFMSQNQKDKVKKSYSLVYWVIFGLFTLSPKMLIQWSMNMENYTVVSKMENTIIIMLFMVVLMMPKKLLSMSNSMTQKISMEVLLMKNFLVEKMVMTSYSMSMSNLTDLMVMKMKYNWNTTSDKMKIEKLSLISLTAMLVGFLVMMYYF